MIEQLKFQIVFQLKFGWVSQLLKSIVYSGDKAMGGQGLGEKGGSSDVSRGFHRNTIEVGLQFVFLR